MNNDNTSNLIPDQEDNTVEKPEYDYIVVGSGAGGGPLAVNLAKAGYKVLLLEAGGDPLQDNNNQACERYSYSVPALHPRSTEDNDLRWDFFVKHYSDEERQRRDSKFDQQHKGILYPRAGTLGGCTAHSSLILVYPHNSDWDRIAEITGDASWGSEQMRQYFERLERCQYIERPINFSKNPSRHGFDGWLTTNRADSKLLARDRQLLKMITQVALTAFKEQKTSLLPLIRKILKDTWTTLINFIKRDGDADPLDFIDQLLDPNDWRVTQGNGEGVFVVPIMTDGCRRRSTRDYIREVEQQFPEYLFVKTHALVTQVLFDQQKTADDEYKAIGVEYLEGKHLYRADPNANQTFSESALNKRVFANREVILSGGTFNTPQLLKLSGIGAKEELTNLGIEVRVDLAGVGTNLQDRYEVGIVSEMKQSLSLLEGCRFREPLSKQEEESDLGFKEWKNSQTGVYTTNGAVLSIIKRSHSQRQDPDLFIFGLPIYFKGYFLKYAEQISEAKNRFTWAILKGHTNNTAGTVTLKSSDPQDVPKINFHYFDEGNDPNGEDLESVLAGVEFVKKLTSRSRLFSKTLIPGSDVDQPEEIKQFIKDEAWGHHACGTCKIGRKDDKMAVLDSNFRVYGTKNLRVVDASVFPSIPGFFIMSAVYMISEKASDVILQDALRLKVEC